MTIAMNCVLILLVTAVIEIADAIVKDISIPWPVSVIIAAVLVIGGFVWITDGDLS